MHGSGMLPIYSSCKLMQLLIEIGPAVELPVIAIKLGEGKQRQGFNNPRCLHSIV